MRQPRTGIPTDLVSRATAVIEAAAPPGIGRYIIHDGAKWHLLDDDGRVVSEHDTREEAEKARDQQTAAEVEKEAEHGMGGNDDTTKAVALTLPPWAAGPWPTARPSCCSRSAECSMSAL